MRHCLAGGLIAGLVLAGCGSTGSPSAATTTKSTSETTTTVNGATVEADVQALGQAISNANTQLELGATVSCGTGSDLQHLHSEVNIAQWSQAAYYAASVKADLATEESQFGEFLAEYPAQKQNFPGPYPWSSLMAAAQQVLAALPNVTVTVHGNC